MTKPSGRNPIVANIYWHKSRFAIPRPWLTIIILGTKRAKKLGTKAKQSREALLARLHRQMLRPGQGPVDGPYWIVMNLSRHKHLGFMPPTFPYRHPTEESARIEAERLAAESDHIGWRFGVFAFTGVTAKVEAPPTPIPVEEPALEVAQAA